MWLGLAGDNLVPLAIAVHKDGYADNKIEREAAEVMSHLMG